MATYSKQYTEKPDGIIYDLKGQTCEYTTTSTAPLPNGYKNARYYHIPSAEEFNKFPRNRKEHRKEKKLKR